MALPASDNFDRANNTTLGGNWFLQAAEWDIASNHAIPAGVSDDNAVYWSADSFGADHYCQITVVTIGDGGPMVRDTGTFGAGETIDGYLLSIGSGATTIQRLDNGSGTVIQSGLATFSNGDTAKLQVVGTTLKAYKNGAQIGTDQADATHASGVAGLYNFGTTGVYDDFLADNVATGPRYILGSH